MLRLLLLNQIVQELFCLAECKMVVSKVFVRNCAQANMNHESVFIFTHQSLPLDVTLANTV